MFRKTRQEKLENIVLLTRITLFIVYFWFGLLKIVGVSPAEGLVVQLFDVTLSHFMTKEFFLPTFGVFECVIGLAWLFPKVTKSAFWLMLSHMVMTFLPMLFLKDVTWEDSFLTLSLVGQYIVKNLVLVSASLFVYVWYKD